MSKVESKNHLAGKLFLCLIGSSLLVVGGVFEWLLVRSYRQAKASREWPQVQVIILKSELEERQISGYPREYSFSIGYDYTFDGQLLESQRFSPRGKKWTKSLDKVNKQILDYPVGSIHSAWVDPADPEFAILRHDTKAAGYTLWFPALVIVGGAGIVVSAFRK